MANAGVATSRKAADASETVANGDHRTSDDDFALELHGRQLLWAQHIAATSGPQSSESENNDDDAEPEPSPEDDKDITTMEPPDGVGKSTAETTTVEKDGGYVRLTVDWRARTRVRSSLQPPKVHSVRVEVLPGELCAQFISRMVQLPPGAAYRDTQLSWGSFTIPPLQMMHRLRLGSWVFDTRAATPRGCPLRSRGYRVDSPRAHGSGGSELSRDALWSVARHRRRTSV